ncbi:hypothetical protein ACFVAV_22425 [Nocardia sp. NPDC057663]|uniref:hypothetical protein n=1 Tax=Nocardia sp. NPDC057663 TaxID=3346201 RepID=UPI00366A7683
MADLSVELPSCAGFAVDLGEIGACSASNVSRLLPAVSLPAGSTGLIATVAPSVEKFCSAVGGALNTEATAISGLGTNLSTAATQLGSTDGAIAAAISATSNGVGAGGAQSADGGGFGVSRFGGLQLPSLPAVPDNVYTVRQTVESAIGLLSVYDERLSAAIGVQPTVDLLSPLVADWESLQAIGKRIGLLGINDYVTSENLINGTKWLQGSWSGEAAQSFGVSSNKLGQTVGTRSLDLDAVSKIVEYGGYYIERLVYNQAADLCGKVLQPMTFLGATFPLGAWAPHINNPINDTMKSEITAALDALKTSTTSRQEEIQTMVDKISSVLEYAPGRSIPVFTSSEFDLPAKIAIDIGTRKFGYGDNMWWEDRVDSVF